MHEDALMGEFYHDFHHFQEALHMNHATSPAEIQEGVIKYQLDFRKTPPVDYTAIAELNAWRELLFRLKLNGIDPERYDGLAYGNVSLRQTGTNRFIISGTQTGSLPRLEAGHYSRVLAFDLSANHLTAEGPLPPSSEALTHAAVYADAPEVNCVLHVHAPEIWSCADRLELPVTECHASYGTPAMAEEVKNLLSHSTRRIIVMGGHKDGLIAVGKTPQEAATNLLECFVEALAIRAA